MQARALVGPTSFSVVTLAACLVWASGCSESPVEPLQPDLPVFLSPFTDLLAARGITESDDGTFGPGSVTQDDNSGLQWLDLTLSTGSSWDFVAAEFGPGGLYSGFRHASIAELSTLFENAGVPDPTYGPGTPSAGNLEPVRGLIELLGATAETPEVQQALGFLGEPSPFVPTNVAVGVLQANLVPGTASADPVQGSDPASSELEIVGHFLVRPLSVSPEERIEDLQEAVATLVGLELNRGQANGISRPLANALRSLGRGKLAPACSQLADFREEVLEKTPPLSPESSQALIESALVVEGELGCG